ncbi:intraflagellar transport protein 22 homolog [Arctopsyche grandis]|uniref:intraflagellar transport protein 22 homolog n=1 Tax=Arctopsyche grandis TaxID=121162 RepID=UPI00406D6F75
MLKLKLLMVGLPGSGKTAIANFLSECVDVESGIEIQPTHGARLLEFDSPSLNVNGSQIKAEIELWDCSGDHRYESCWPAFRSNTQGVIFVCSFNNALNAAREFELLYDYFVSQPGLSPKQCVVFYYTTEIQQQAKGLRLSSTFGKISQVPVNIMDGGNKLRSDFSNYLVSVISSSNP